MRGPADRSPKRRAAPPARREPPAGPRYPVPALDKGLDVLELLAREARGLSLNEIAVALGRTSSELFRMVNGLARRGYIEQRDGERYTLTLKLFELAHRHKPIKSLTAAAAPLMDRLAHRSLQSCHLTVFHDGCVMVVGEVDSPERYAFGMKVGALVGLTDTASGYVLLAFQDEETRRAMLRVHQKAEGELDVDPAQLLKIIRKVERQGYAEVQSRQTRGVTNIAFPILGSPGRARAVLNIPYVERIDRKVTPSVAAIKDLLRETAAELSLLMGHVASDPA
jgi:DNA-binding IclR family transcriptional regulator